MKVRRGEIHYIENRIEYNEGAEIRKNRPAIVVSNNAGNEHSQTIEVVYMTSAPKKDLPTHVYIGHTTGPVSGTALCESVYTVAKSRLQENSYTGRVRDEDMERIDEALIISLGLDEYMYEQDENVEYEEPEMGGVQR